METRANYALIGLFTLVVFAGMLGFVYWFAAARNNGAKMSYRVVFTGSVSGLTRGSLVRFNGLRVGEVTTIDLVPNDPSRVMAVIEVDQKTPVKTDTRARLEYQGLTGQASVQLSGGTAAAPALVSPDGARPVIYADRSDFQDILETVQRLATRTDGILARVEKVVSDNEGSLGNTIRSVETFAKALADNSAGVGAFLASIGETAQRISSLSTRLEALSTTAEELLRSVDASSVNRTVANVEGFTRALADNRQNIDALLADGAVLAKRLSDSSQRLDTALAEVNRIAKSIDGEKIGRSVENIDRFAQALGNNTAEAGSRVQERSRHQRHAAQRLDPRRGGARCGAAVPRQRDRRRQQGRLRRDCGPPRGRSANWPTTSRAARAASARRRGPSIGSRRASKSARARSRPGSTASPPLAVAISRRSAADARRAANEVNRAVRNLGNDPSQIIRGGGPSIPEYSGAR